MGRGKGDESDDGGVDGAGVVGASSLAIVPTTAAVVPMVYPVPGVSVRATVSSGSTLVSAVASTVTVAVAPPGTSWWLAALLGSDLYRATRT